MRGQRAQHLGSRGGQARQLVRKCQHVLPHRHCRQHAVHQVRRRARHAAPRAARAQAAQLVPLRVSRSASQKATALSSWHTGHWTWTKPREKSPHSRHFRASCRGCAPRRPSGRRRTPPSPRRRRARPPARSGTSKRSCRRAVESQSRHSVEHALDQRRLLGFIPLPWTRDRCGLTVADKCPERSSPPRRWTVKTERGR